MDLRINQVIVYVNFHSIYCISVHLLHYQDGYPHKKVCKHTGDTDIFNPKVIEVLSVCLLLQGIVLYVFPLIVVGASISGKLDQLKTKHLALFLLVCSVKF